MAKKKAAKKAEKKSRTKAKANPLKPPPDLLAMALQRALEEMGYSAEDLAKPNIKREAVLACIEATGNVSESCRACGVPRRTFYDWLDQDVEYKNRYEGLRPRLAGLILDAIVQRGVYGVPRLKFYQGQVVIDPTTGAPYVEREFSDACLLALGAGLMPDLLGSKHRVEHAGRIDGENTLTAAGSEGPRLTILLRDPGGRVPPTSSS